MAGSISQSSHQNGSRVSRRAVNRRPIAITANTNVARFTPSIRLTWVSSRLTVGGGVGSAIVDNEQRLFLIIVSTRVENSTCFNLSRFTYGQRRWREDFMPVRGETYEGSQHACVAPKYALQ